MSDRVNESPGRHRMTGTPRRTAADSTVASSEGASTCRRRTPKNLAPGVGRRATTSGASSRTPAEPTSGRSAGPAIAAAMASRPRASGRPTAASTSMPIHRTTASTRRQGPRKPGCRLTASRCSDRATRGSGSDSPVTISNAPLVEPYQRSKAIGPGPSCTKGASAGMGNSSGRRRTKGAGGRTCFGSKGVRTPESVREMLVPTEPFQYRRSEGGSRRRRPRRRRDAPRGGGCRWLEPDGAFAGRGGAWLQASEADEVRSRPSADLRWRSFRRSPTLDWLGGSPVAAARSRGLVCGSLPRCPRQPRSSRPSPSRPPIGSIRPDGCSTRASSF